MKGQAWGWKGLEAGQSVPASGFSLCLCHLPLRRPPSPQLFLPTHPCHRTPVALLSWVIVAPGEHEAFRDLSGPSSSVRKRERKGRNRGGLGGGKAEA